MTNDGTQARISTGSSPAWEDEMGAQPGSIPQQMSWTGTYQEDSPNWGSPPSPHLVTSQSGLHKHGKPGISPKSEAAVTDSPGALEAVLLLIRAVEKAVPRASLSAAVKQGSQFTGSQGKGLKMATRSPKWATG